MQRQKHLEHLARDAISKLVQDCKRVDELPLPKIIKADIVKCIATPPHEKELEKWFGLRVREKALYYWSLQEQDCHLLSADIGRYENPAFDFYYAKLNDSGIVEFNGIDNYEELFDSEMCKCSKVRETRQFIIARSPLWWRPLSHHPIYRMIDKFYRSDEKCYCTDLVILSHLPPEIFFNEHLDTFKHVLMVQREERWPPPPLSGILDWFENRQKALYYWYSREGSSDPYFDITRHIPDKSQIYTTYRHLKTQTSYPENCQFIIVIDFDHVCPTESHTEFLIRCITKQYSNLLDEVTGEPCQFKQGADMIFISQRHPKDSFGSAFSKDYFNLVIHDELFDSLSFLTNKRKRSYSY